MSPPSRHFDAHWLGIVVPLALMFALFNACRTGSDPAIDRDGFDEAAVELEARDMLDAYGRAQRERGLLAEVPYLDTSDRFFWVPPGFSGRISRDSVIAILTTNAASIESVDPQWTELEVSALSATAAVYTGRLRATVVKTSGDTAMTELLETGVLIKRGDGWKLLCGQTGVAPAEVTAGQ